MPLAWFLHPFQLSEFHLEIDRASTTDFHITVLQESESASP
jgi:hypothetical protein